MAAVTLITADELRQIVARSARSNTTRRHKRGSAGKCEACGYTPPIPRLRDRILHAHHIVPLGCNGTDLDFNLIVICANCHALAHGFWSQRRGRWCGPRTRKDFLLKMAGLLKGDTTVGISRAAFKVDPAV